MNTFPRVTKLPNVSLGWNEGRYADRWMLVHFGVGVVGGFSNVFFGLSVVTVFIVGAVLMCSWEAFEYTVGIREARTNIAIDVLVGLAGTSLALALAARVSARAETALFVASATATGTGGLFGWLASRKRKRQGGGR